MVKEIIVKQIAEELRTAYEAEGIDVKPSLATLEERYGIPSQVISFAIIQAGGTIRPRENYRVNLNMKNHKKKRWRIRHPTTHETVSLLTLAAGHVVKGTPLEIEQTLKNEYKKAGHQIAQTLAAFYIGQSNPENAETWVEIALEGNPRNPFSHYLRDMLHRGNENWEEATASWEEATATWEQAEALSDSFREQEKVY